VPSTLSTAKLLKVTATVPTALATVTGQIAGLCGGISYSYTMTASALANSYVITAPAGSVVKSASNMSNNTNVLATSDLTFTVLYPEGFASTTAVGVKSIVISSVNGVGASVLNRTVILTTLMPAVGISTGGTTFQRCTTQTFSVPAVVGATNYVWTVADGAVIVGAATTNSVVVDFALVSALKLTNKLTVKAANSCGVFSGVKSITLTSTACPGARVASTTKAAFAISTTEVYPNPASNYFNIAITASKSGVSDEFNVIAYPNPSSGVFNIKIESSDKGEKLIHVYDMTGRLIEQLNVQSNSVELGSRYSAGIYKVIIIQGGKYKILQIIKD
jgi:hypothetical protein